jgi:hypothetical protein
MNSKHVEVEIIEVRGDRVIEECWTYNRFVPLRNGYGYEAVVPPGNGWEYDNTLDKDRWSRWRRVRMKTPNVDTQANKK